MGALPCAGHHVGKLGVQLSGKNRKLGPLELACQARTMPCGATCALQHFVVPDILSGKIALQETRMPMAAACMRQIEANPCAGHTPDTGLPVFRADIGARSAIFLIANACPF